MTYSTGTKTNLVSPGKSVDVGLLYTVEGEQVAYVDGWLGITGASGDSGESVALFTDRREYHFTVPAGLTVNKGDTVYIEVDGLVGHIPEDDDYNTDPSGLTTPIALFKATSAKDANNNVTGILIGGL